MHYRTQIDREIVTAVPRNLLKSHIFVWRTLFPLHTLASPLRTGLCPLTASETWGFWLASSVFCFGCWCSPGAFRSWGAFLDGCCVASERGARIRQCRMRRRTSGWLAIHSAVCTSPKNWRYLLARVTKWFIFARPSAGTGTWARRRSWQRTAERADRMKSFVVGPGSTKRI